MMAAGYSRLIEADEEGTLGRLNALRAELIDPKIVGHHLGGVDPLGPTARSVCPRFA
jgi:hypothetical protein